MAKAKMANSATKKRERMSDDEGSQETPGSVFLDQAEIMKTMRAQMEASADKGKGRDESSDVDETDSSEAEDDDEARSQAETSDAGSKAGGVESYDEHESEAESSTQALSPKTSVAVLPSRVTAASRASVARPFQNAGLTSVPKPSPETTFECLGLSALIISALRSISIRKPTEIQSACVGPIMAGRDCIGGAKTGSGKTMAFALPILERIAKDPFGVFAVVLTPTRELAYQLTEQFLVLGRPLGLTTVTIVGGMDMMTQAQQLALRPHVVVATPGRLCDLLRSNEGGGGEGALSRVRVLVLDEADRMLTPTFAPELNYLFSVIPLQRQTCLFTATVSPAIMALAEKEPTNGREKPFVYRVESETMTVKNLKQHYLFIPSHIRDPYLYYLLLNPPQTIDSALRQPPPKPTAEHSRPSKKRKPTRREPTPEPPAPVIPSTIIFTQRCATAHLIHLLLTELSIPSVPLHSHLSQPQRLLSLAQFRAGTVPVLVTTDVGSRGLDIPEVAMVVNWDCPRRSDDYVHRVGRTARAGRGGVAVTIVTERDTELVQTIEKEISARLVDNMALLTVTDVKLTELKLPEEKVLENLNPVSLAKRVASMAMHDSSFGERQATNKAKAIKRARRDAAIA